MRPWGPRECGPGHLDLGRLCPRTEQTSLLLPKRRFGGPGRAEPPHSEPGFWLGTLPWASLQSGAQDYW